jgi:hypothetical protein
MRWWLVKGQVGLVQTDLGTDRCVLAFSELEPSSEFVQKAVEFPPSDGIERCFVPNPDGWLGAIVQAETFPKACSRALELLALRDFDAICVELCDLYRKQRQQCIENSIRVTVDVLTMLTGASLPAVIEVVAKIINVGAFEKKVFRKILEEKGFPIEAERFV